MNTITNAKKFCKNHSAEIGVACASLSVSAGLAVVGYRLGSYNTLVKHLRHITAGKQMTALTASAMMMEDGASFLGKDSATGEPVKFILKRVK